MKGPAEVTLFDTPLGQVTYEQVLDFCRTFPEGVRVEYKREPGNSIPKVVSSFANSVGGVWIIGVEVDKKTNRAIFPLVGLDQPGVEEQIVQSAQQGVYPSITPAVRVFPIPDQPGRTLLVVKVPESVEAPHAVENSTRVYIRTGSTTQPYDLAEIDRIEYLLKRRQEPEQRREKLIEQAAARSAYKDHSPRVRVIVCPVYPRGVLLPHDELYERAELLEKQNVQYLRDFRLVHEAVASTGDRTSVAYYFELSIFGIAFYEGPIDVVGYADKANQLPFLYLGQLLYPVGGVLNTALAFLRGSMTNLLIRYELMGWQGIAFLPTEYSRLMHPKSVAEIHRCTDPHIVVSTTAPAESLIESTARVRVLSDLAQQVLWAFNYRQPAQDLRTHVYEVAKALRLV